MAHSSFQIALPLMSNMVPTAGKGAALQPIPGDATGMSVAFSFFAVFVLIIIVVGVARNLSRFPGVQRPVTEATAFQPPPPPDTVLVKCPYCGTVQKFQKACSSCGGPLPRPSL
ncbi:MAG: hypothetical protein HY296_01090 [Thaumarchaeota archaeon]|nr:hypothetical protein [Nitrososphaerota archaeon]